MRAGCLGTGCPRAWPGMSERVRVLICDDVALLRELLRYELEEVDDSLADGQADTRARVFVGAVQTREHAEDALGLRRVDADPVVPNAEAPAVGHLGRPDADARRLVAGELDRVRDQVLEQLAQS